jgi:HEAT repeats
VRTKRVAPVIARHFGWLEPLGYDLLEASDSWGPSATYVRGIVLVRLSYEYRDEYADLTIARRQKEDLREEPYWAQVHLDELLRERVPSAGPWRGESIDEAFARGAELLREHAGDLLAGENLNVLDEIVAKRPHHGVPGLDFPVAEPWALSQEGVMFTTDSEMPRDMAHYIERTRSEDPATRAVGALKIVIAGRGTGDQGALSAGHERLHDLLSDTDTDVRRAAASALGEWRDADALDEILSLLDQETGEQVSPIAAAATYLALDGNKGDRERTLDALKRFASRGEVAAGQVDELEWRLDGSRGYPRVMKLWRGPKQ